MKLNELIETYGEYELKDGFMDFLEAPKPKTVWDLEYGDYYHYIHDGGIYYSPWANNRLDNLRRCVGNCYLNNKEGEFALERMKIITELKRLGGTEDMMSLGDVRDSKYFIVYDHSYNRLYIDSQCHSHLPLNVYFATKKQAENAVKEIGEDRIKKYLFYVKESETK